MIAFCFLTYDGAIAPEIWTEYFKNVSEEEYLILTNSKYSNVIKTQPLFANSIIKNCITGTEWGTFSLLEAQHELILEAISNPEVAFTILISHNSIPIQSFRDLQSYLFRNKSSIISKEIVGIHQCRYSTIKKPQFPNNSFYTMSQWHVLSRLHAEFITKDFITIKEIFGGMVIPDEHVYLNYLIHYKKCTDIIFSNICTVNWRDKATSTKNKTYDRGIEVFSVITKDMMDAAIASNAFFIRKVTASVRFNCDYIKNIAGHGHRNRPILDGFIL